MSHAHRVDPRHQEAEVPLAVVGVDFRVASSKWRNCLLLGPEERASLTEGLRRSCAVEGMVVLETCNRVEWILAAGQPRWAAEVLRAQMQDRWVKAQLGGPPDPARVGYGLPVPYMRVGQAAVAHILRVAVGLESFVVGEREIAGQLNKAVVEARSQGHASPLLNALQTAVGRTVRKVQRLTQWRHHARGVHGLALEAAQHRLPGHAERRTAIVVGMGEIGRKAALLFATTGWKVVRVNRTVPAEKAREWQPLLTLDTLLAAGADLLVVATGANRPVVDLRAMTTALLVVDLGAPPQVEPGPETTLLGLDDLLQLPSARPPVSDEQTVQELVDEGVAEFLVECKKRDLAGLLRATHDAYDRVCYEDLPTLLETELGDTLDPDRRRRLHQALRDLLRGYAREIVQHIESAAHARTPADGTPRATLNDREAIAAVAIES